MTGNPLLLVIVAGIMFAVLGGVTLLSHIYSLNGIKSNSTISRARPLATVSTVRLDGRPKQR